MNSILYGNRYKSPIGVCELMAFFAATHTSINALPGSTDAYQAPQELDTAQQKTEAKVCPFMPQHDMSACK